MKPRLLRIYRIGTVALLAVFFAFYFLHAGFNLFINDIFSTFASMDHQVVRDFIASYGPLAASISFFLMIFQAIVAPLPAFLITFANAALFGAFWGGVLSWTSSMAGVALCFYIARIYGRAVVERFTGRAVLEAMDGFFDRYGRHTIVICRLLPFVPFDPVSYAAGLTNMRFWHFFIATGLGQLPATIVYSYVGGMLTGGARLFVTGLFIVFALSILVFMLKRMYDAKQGRRHTDVAAV